MAQNTCPVWTDNSSWMSKLPDEVTTLPLNSLAIPGTLNCEWGEKHIDPHPYRNITEGNTRIIS